MSYFMIKPIPFGNYRFQSKFSLLEKQLSLRVCDIFEDIPFLNYLSWFYPFASLMILPILCP